MPVHDWKKAPKGCFHHFHQQWVGELCDALNAGRLPAGFFALVETQTMGVVPDVQTIRRQARNGAGNGAGNGPVGGRSRSGGVAVAEAPPRTRFVLRQTQQEAEAKRASRVAIHESFGELVAIVEVVSPGNKDREEALTTFVEKAQGLLEAGVHLLLVDLFPPGRRDPQGVHPLIWGDDADGEFALPAEAPLTLASYRAGLPREAYVEPVAVGAALPEMPLFLARSRYVPTPLESSYLTTWNKCPVEFRELVGPGAE